MYQGNLISGGKNYDAVRMETVIMVGVGLLHYFMLSSTDNRYLFSAIQVSRKAGGWWAFFFGGYNGKC